MKAARKYIDTLRANLREWNHCIEDGQRLIDIGEKIFITDIATKNGIEELGNLDVRDVKEAILEHEEEIEFRLKRINDDFKFLEIVQFIINTQDQKARLSDSEANDAIDRYRKLIERKALELIRVIDECEKYIKPQNPVIAKALEGPILLSYFYDNKKVLKEYINFCLSDDANIKLKAMRAMELANKGMG